MMSLEPSEGAPAGSLGSSISSGKKPSRRATELATREPAALRSAIRLLDEAGRALSVSQDDARRFIARAAALLQAELDLKGHVFHHAAGAGAARYRLAPWQVKRVMRFIDANLSIRIGLHNLADHLRLSASHFARAFRATVGKSPHAFLMHRRIERAKEMMLETDLPIAQIALDCGLADQSHFTKRFTRIVGMSPGAWRRVRVQRSGSPSRAHREERTRRALVEQAGTAAAKNSLSRLTHCFSKNRNNADSALPL